MQSPQRKSKALEHLFSAFPPLNAVDPDETLRRYFEAVEDFDAELIETAVTLYVKGQVVGFDGRFVPTPPMLATGCRKAAELRDRQRYLERVKTPALPAPEVQRTAESMAEVRAKMEDAVSKLGGTAPADDAAIAAADRAAKEKLAKHDTFFAGDFVPTSGGVGRISRSLAAKIGYRASPSKFSVGDADSDQDVA